MFFFGGKRRILIYISHRTGKFLFSVIKRNENKNYIQRWHFFGVFRYNFYFFSHCNSKSYFIECTLCISTSSLNIIYVVEQIFPNNHKLIRFTTKLHKLSSFSFTIENESGKGQKIDKITQIKLTKFYLNLIQFVWNSYGGISVVSNFEQKLFQNVKFLF